MQKVFQEVNTLDQRCYETFALSGDILMEHAAEVMADEIRARFELKNSVLILAGSGHNGADGIALARLLHHDYDVKLYCIKDQNSDLGKLQVKRAKALNVTFVTELSSSDIIVDALFGSGLNRSLEGAYLTIIKELNQSPAFKIACDIPSGVLSSGLCSSEVFKADLTITMGALKRALFSDEAKNYTGEIKVANLGLPRSLYETDTDTFLLDLEDLQLPLRDKPNTHKGTFGHTAVLSGDKSGASIIAGLSALAFGSGLVTLVGDNLLETPYELMSDTTLPENTIALCAGMGLGETAQAIDLLKKSTLPMVIDADLFYDPSIGPLLEKPCVLTPHPKEFVSLLALTGLDHIDIQILQADRFGYALKFSQAFPETVLLLKGAHVIIAYQGKLYINPHGTNKLSKGGSGDVLAGLIAALLAQGYDPIDATISGSLAHTKAALTLQNNNYALTPPDLIQAIGHL